jgi:hypothetical protein
MKCGSWSTNALVLAAGTLFLAFAVSTSAQVKSETTTTHGTPTKEVTVEHAEVLLVEGNDLILKMEDGTIRHIPNVPESDKIDVGGKMLGIHDLKPGMKLERTITVTTTPKVVTTVQTVSGKVFHVTPPNSVILTLDDGTNQKFSIPSGQKFNINGKETDAFGLKKGMKISATKIVEEPITVAEHEQKLTGKMPAPAQSPAADVPILVVLVMHPAPPSTEAASAAAPAALPKTASNLPLIGLLGLFCLGASFGLRRIRASQLP